jgi:pimeloyl-ACP methyl ester carboxylesterase
MINLRKYGKPPYSVAVIHGGPGAAGEMQPMAIELSKNFGVLEPLQTKDSIEGQIQELKQILNGNLESSVTLIGYSWGAWLAWMFAARYPFLVQKLILVSGGPFEEKYVSEILKTRLSHLEEKEKAEAKNLIEIFNDKKQKANDESFSRFGELMSKADTYKKIESSNIVNDEIKPNSEIYQKVWSEASELRKSGKLLEMGKLIKCPVVAIHGNYDPHPADGVKIPLSKILKNFKFILLPKCGHTPWVEKFAREKFFKILKNEIHTISSS